MRIKELILTPILSNNPIALGVLGVCSALAVTVQLKNVFVMCAAVTMVVALANMGVSLIRNHVPSSIRIIVQMVIIATLVIIAEQFLKAFVYDQWKTMAVYVGLIITNCIVMGRLEAFALGHGVYKSFLDGIGNAAGYAFILILVAFFRELLGAGKLLGYQIIPDSFYELGYRDNGLMLLSPMALITVGLIIWVQRSRSRQLIEQN
jgi:Na+-transporting NADH:ubiquinone oxidoreductase subunit D